MSVTSKDEVYFADGVCPYCFKPWWVIQIKTKPQGVFCTTCKTKINAIFRTLVVDKTKYRCNVCSEIIYKEEAPGESYFHMENGKAVRHMCDLKEQAERMRKGEFVIKLPEVLH